MWNVFIVAKLVFPHSSIFLPEKRTHFQLNLCQHGRRDVMSDRRPTATSIPSSRELLATCYVQQCWDMTSKAFEKLSCVWRPDSRS